MTRKEFITTNITAVAGNQTYLLITPTGGVAFWTASEPIATQIHSGSVFTPFLTPDATQLFGGVGNSAPDSITYSHPNTSYVTQGRMMSCAAELNCLNNAFNQYGSIAVYKTPLTYEKSVSLFPAEGWSDVSKTGSMPVANPIGGCQALSSQTLNGEAYVRPVRDGAYAVSMSHEREFEWRDVNDGEEMKTVHLGPLDFPGDVTIIAPLPSVHFNGPIPLWDNSYDTIVMRIEVPATVTDQSFIVSVWKRLSTSQPSTACCTLWLVSHPTAMTLPSAFILPSNASYLPPSLRKITLTFGNRSLTLSTVSLGSFPQCQGKSAPSPKEHTRSHPYLHPHANGPAHHSLPLARNALSLRQGRRLSPLRVRRKVRGRNVVNI